MACLREKPAGSEPSADFCFSPMFYWEEFPSLIRRISSFIAYEKSLSDKWMIRLRCEIYFSVSLKPDEFGGVL
jgi:hypothetical protein